MKKKVRIDLLELEVIQSKNRLLASRMASISGMTRLKQLWQVDRDRIAELETELAKFTECVASNGCVYPDGYIHSFQPLSFSEQGPMRIVYHKEGE